ncbi:4-hydroxy-3-methylbut-2-enyl diphosphate reductase [Candidatus Beckwithbacteria bacterium RBG_13_42_9]|uniref:4-hydroxy-3-methylbut-2-enyl diphosphate reductase n=1 Tax=Candidatus Beckwithbacteria bacterium RBG_13_42_9 TaxID=1797457 RepID=A0A1F5E4R0_9BACT|nr:MAG: 4-hydroxy-3-methylbut-2-enyl diphosphate reductase [Candidatus Beckwithbacteria bacterium RBG_13_42_9]
MIKDNNLLEEVILVKPRGFCAGVKRAIEILELVLEKYGLPIYVNHQIIHNTHVMEEFTNKGIIFVDDLEQIPDGSRVVFSAHGSPPGLYEKAKRKRLKIFDATCPLVTKVHSEAKRYEKEGYYIFYVGHDLHPETMGVLQEVKPQNIALINGLSQAKKINPPQVKKLVLLNQTTLSLDDFQEITSFLKEKYPNLTLPLGKDICYATRNRQTGVKLLAKKVELILVVGSSFSSNSNRLCEVAQNRGIKAYLIDDSGKMKNSWLDKVKHLGITSGASVPEKLVKDLLDRLKKQYPKLKIREKKYINEDQIKFSLPKELQN